MYTHMYMHFILFPIFPSELNVCVKSDKHTFKFVCNSSDFQPRAPSFIPPCRPDWSRAGGWAWTARSPRTEQGTQRAPEPSARHPTSRRGRPACCLKRRADGGLAIIYTRFLPCFNLTEKCLEIRQTSANRPDLHDRGAESRGRKLIFREALWARDSLVAFGAL